jgi:predicted Co/Zn/Cd cation transporter (cation efflux family)
VAVLLPAELRLSIGELDALRAEIGAAIGGEGPERWLTIVFTADAAEL